jgi:2-haloacid dehalogenase
VSVLTPTTSSKATPKVLAFDVFGTLVDWFGSIEREMQVRLAHEPVHRSPAAFALAWRAGYQPAMQRVRSGELGWTRIDDLHRRILDDILPQFGLQAMDEAARRELNLVWHRLQPWNDTADALRRLRSKYRLCTLSNGNLGLLADLARHGGMSFDLILSAEVFKAYKPDPATYLGVAQVFDLKPEEVMLVAAHKEDLAAAQACGCQGAYIERPAEFGPTGQKDLSRDHPFEHHARDLHDLADQLGCP